MDGVQKRIKIGEGQRLEARELLGMFWPQKVWEEVNKRKIVKPQDVWDGSSCRKLSCQRTPCSAFCALQLLLRSLSLSLRCSLCFAPCSALSTALWTLQRPAF